jgi:hypothetical protein
LGYKGIPPRENDQQRRFQKVLDTVLSYNVQENKTKKEFIMGRKYCPECKEVGRKIIHREEDGGCGHRWYTLELLEDALIRSR